MKSLRNYVYAAVLAASALSVAPTIASAQEPARGKFTLTHEVRWGNAKLAAGDYQFAYDPNAMAHTLSVSKVSGSPTAYMLLVTNTEDPKPADGSLLLLESTPEGTFVSAMQLPEFGMTLRFPVPTHAESKIARSATTGLAAGQ